MTLQIKRLFYPNGRLRIEEPQQNGKAHGLSKEYHPNGRLAAEIPCENGIHHGTAKFWATDGKALGEFTLDHGTGLSKSWYDNGAPSGEVPLLKGLPTGLQKTWYEDGLPVGDVYWIRGKQVTRKKYMEACKSDPELPEYDDSQPKSRVRLPSTKYKKSKATVSDEQRNQHNVFIAELRAKPNQVEARQWLTDNDERNIGEMTPKDSREVVDAGYNAGACRIIAVDVREDSTDCLIVEVPPKGSARKRVFEWNNELAQRSGFDPDVDWGQDELFVFLD